MKQLRPAYLATIAALLYLTACAPVNVPAPARNDAEDLSRSTTYTNVTRTDDAVSVTGGYIPPEGALSEGSRGMMQD